MRGLTAEALLLQAAREVHGVYQRAAMREGFVPERSVYVVIDVRQDVRDLAAAILRTTADFDDAEAAKEVRRRIAEAKRRRTAFVLGGVLQTDWVAKWFQERTPDQADTMVARLSAPARPGFAHVLVMADGGRTIHQIAALEKPGG